MGGILGGITLIFISFLTLSVDVLEKFKTDNDAFGHVTVTHLDELYESARREYDVRLEVFCYLQKDTDSCHFIILLPQFLVDHKDARDVFLGAVAH